MLVYRLLAPTTVENLSVFFFFFWPRCAACGDLGIKLASLAMKVWSPNHWTAGEFPVSPVICYFVVISPLSLSAFKVSFLRYSVSLWCRFCQASWSRGLVSFTTFGTFSDALS